MTTVSEIYAKNPADVAAYTELAAQLIEACDKYLNSEESPIAVEAAKECIKYAQAVKWSSCAYNAYMNALSAEKFMETAENNYWG